MRGGRGSSSSRPCCRRDDRGSIQLSANDHTTSNVPAGDDGAAFGSLLSLAAVGTTALALLSAWIVAILLWPRMPNFMPLDLGSDGLPERWGETTALRWFTPPIIATVIAAAFVVVERVGLIVVRRRSAPPDALAASS